MTHGRPTEEHRVREGPGHQPNHRARPGTLPEPRLAALVTNPAAWVDGKLPRLRTNKAETEKDPEDDNASGDDPDDASGNGSDPGPDAADPGDDPDDKPAPRATAKKTTSRRQSSSQ